MNNSEQCAFSCITAEGVAGVEYSGLTKREYFAGLAMQGFISANLEVYRVNGGYIQWDAVSKASVEIADVLLKELEKPQL